MPSTQQNKSSNNDPIYKESCALTTNPKTQNSNNPSPLSTNQTPNATKATKTNLIFTMQTRLIVLWTASKQIDKPLLQQKNANAVKLWRHIRDCQDKHCRRKHCRSSRFLVQHFLRCQRRSRCETCQLCAPVVRYMDRHSCRSGDGIEKKHRNNNARARICDLGKNDSFLRYQPTVFPVDVGYLSTTAATSVRCCDYPLKPCLKQHRRKVVQWSKDVKGGQEEEGPQTITAKKRSYKEIQRNVAKKQRLI